MKVLTALTLNLVFQRATGVGLEGEGAAAAEAAAAGKWQERKKLRKKRAEESVERKKWEVKPKIVNNAFYYSVIKKKGERSKGKGNGNLVRTCNPVYGTHQVLNLYTESCGNK
ncbi:hypothetical protein RUM43_007104 [Polyplax serrata]|uniref:Secreted protein n=1 Tax=Polyplax serrata TaxID=468196 RepID=A0AAN8S598_POLSC